MILIIIFSLKPNHCCFYLDSSIQKKNRFWGENIFISEINNKRMIPWQKEKKHKGLEKGKK
jgi:hypothetical protein